VVLAVVFILLDRCVGQTHEHLNYTQRVLDNEDDENSLESEKTVRPHNLSAEFLVMIFVPIVAAIVLLFTGLSLSL